MKMNKKPLPISTICAQKGRIDATPDYQRPPVWSRKQKQLLIDSILREYDIPKMYWRSVARDDGTKYEVIDGQQRLRTIWEFHAGEFALAKDIDLIDGINCAGKKYADLDMDISVNFDSYAVDVVIVDDAIQTEEEDEVRDMFLRLQNGTTLKAQEKRNAMPGKMCDFVKQTAEHAFFANCKFKNSRFTYDHVAAQMVCLEMMGGPSNVRDSDLNRLYRDNTDFDANGKIAKKVVRTLNFLKVAFPEKAPELERYSAITLYLLASTLIENYASQGIEGSLAKWFFGFEAERRANELLEEDDRDTQLVEYRRLISQSTDAEESIKGRLETMERRFFLAFPDIEPLDEKRGFTAEQRLAIYRRDGGLCQLKLLCDGGRLTWTGNWHADHIVAFSKGGKTTVANGQVACAPCNLAKSDR